jgi:hypothetical protein
VEGLRHLVRGYETLPANSQAGTGSNGRTTRRSASVMPELRARQSHDRDAELDSPRADAKNCGNRASW